MEEAPMCHCGCYAAVRITAQGDDTTLAYVCGIHIGHAVMKAIEEHPLLTIDSLVEG
jgi:hypothetical protein